MLLKNFHNFKCFIFLKIKTFKLIFLGLRYQNIFYCNLTYKSNNSKGNNYIFILLSDKTEKKTTNGRIKSQA